MFQFDTGFGSQYMSSYDALIRLLKYSRHGHRKLWQTSQQRLILGTMEHFYKDYVRD